MLPLPGSAAICAGTLANATAAGISADQRGFGFDPLCSPGAVDAGAVQSNYALSFTTQPPSGTPVDAVLTPAPAVSLTESGMAAAAFTGAATVSDADSALGGTLSANFAAGSAAFGNLKLTSGVGGDTLTATVPLNPSLTPPLNLTAVSGAVTADVAASLTSPAAGSTLPGSSATFAWSAGSGATAYQLWIGSTGINSQNLYSSGALTATSATVNHLPTDGETIYARLYTELNGVWIHADYTFTAASQAAIASPAAGSTLTGPQVAFTWSPGNATQYQLWVGTTGVNSQDLYSSGATAATAATVTVPLNGETIYARLYSLLNGVWTHTDYVYTAPTQAAIVSPAAGATLSGFSTAFTWSPGVGATAYQLWLGSGGVNTQDSTPRAS